MNITTVVFGGGISTLGMDVVVQSLKNSSGGPELRVTSFDPANPFSSLSDCDVLLVSLYWFDNLLSYFSFLKKFGIDPRKKGALEKPIIILGGVSAINYKLLNGFFDFIVLGDGEIVLPDLIRAISKNEKLDSAHVICRDVPVDKKSFAHSPIIPAYGYTENRGNQTTRIEIARGCKNKCPFCQLGHTKPYVEQPIEVVSVLLSRARSKAVGLFAPDRASYSHFEDLEKLCEKWGKHNTAEDLRLDALERIKSVSKLKFGIEGFTEATRKKIRKVSTNEKLIEGFRRIFFDLKKPNGKTHTTATAYMIGDLPGETPEAALEFWEVLAQIDAFAKPPFTLFLTLNSFSPKPFTPWGNEGIHPYNAWASFWRARPRLKTITIAARGGMQGPTNRITHALTARGDERLTKLLFWLATDGHALYKDSSEAAGLRLEKLIGSCGVNPKSIYSEVRGEDMPYSGIEANA